MMTKIGIAILFSILLKGVFAQSENDFTIGIHSIAEVNPEFPGGEKALFEFLGENTKFPAIAKDAGIQGIVYVQFVIMEDGSINPDMVEILRGVHPALDQEAIRVIKLMPNWVPGYQRGQAVRVYYKLPFRFYLK